MALKRPLVLSLAAIAAILAFFAFNQGENVLYSSDQVMQAPQDPAASGNYSFVNFNDPLTSPLNGEDVGVTDKDDSDNNKIKAEKRKAKKKLKNKKKRKAKNYKKPTLALYEKTSVPTERFTINNKKEAVITGSNGTLVSIPRNCFVNKNGKPVKGRVEIELKEVFSKSDILLSNAPTISDGRVIETNGAIYVNATLNGEQLVLAENSSLYVELPSDESPRDMLIFSGNYNQKGNMNWTPTGQLSKLLYTLPFKTLDLKTASMSDEVYEQIVQEENAHTFLATRAFKSRVNFLEETSHIHNKTNEILTFYVKNKNSSLVEVDSKIINYFGELASCYPFVEKAHKTHKGVFKARKEYMDFYDEKLRREDLIYTHNVNVEDENAYEKMVASGMEPMKAKKVMQHNETRLAIIENERKMRNAKIRNNLGEVAKSFARNRFELDRLGWANCDRFVSFPEKTRQMVKIVKPEGLYTEAFLVFKTLRAVISGKSDETGQYYIFENIPKNAKATIVAVGFMDEVPYVATKEVTLGKKDMVDVWVESTEMEAFTQNIKELDKTKL